MRLSGDALELTMDPERRLRVQDPEGRQSWISCGCALFNARCSLAGEDSEFRVHRFPDGPDSPVFARLELLPVAPSPEARAARAGLADLDPAIPVRRTNRMRFAEGEISDGLLARLAVAAAAEGARLSTIGNPAHRTALADLSRRADALQNADAAYRAELRTWVTDDPQRRDGVPSSAVPHVDGNSGDEIPLRDFDTRGNGRLPADTHSTRNQSLLLLSTPGDLLEDWLAAGEALERIQLEITRFGYVSSPLTQALEIPETREQLRGVLGLTDEPQFLIRVGRANPTTPTPRRGLDDVLTEHRQ